MRPAHEQAVEGQAHHHRNRGLEVVMPYAACVLADYAAFKPDGESTRRNSSDCRSSSPVCSDALR